MGNNSAFTQFERLVEPDFEPGPDWGWWDEFCEIKYHQWGWR